MKKTIKLFGLSIVVAVVGFFASANLASAQNVVASCNSATLNGYVITNGVTTKSWFEWATSQSEVTSDSGTRTPQQTFTANANFSQLVTRLTANTTYYYRAVASNSGGTTNGRPSSFRTPECAPAASQPTVTVNISADQTNVAYNNATTIRWNANNATSCSVSGGTNGWSGSQNSTSGSFSTGALTNNTTYSITCTNSGGSNTSSVSVLVGQQAVASQPSATTISASPSLDYVVLSGYVNPNGTNDTSRWFEWGTSQNLGNTTQQLTHGSLASGYSATLSGLTQNTTYYYRAVARNAQGTVQGSTLSFTTTYVAATVQGSAPAATTLLATELTNSTARLNGLVFTSEAQPSTAWFEWGDNTSLSNKTTITNIGALPVVRHDYTLSGLVSGRTYYYRIVAENTYGKVYGTAISFRAGAPVVQNTTTIISPVTRTVTVVARGASTQSLAIISIDGGAEVITNGEKRAYHITWKNTNGSTLKNVVVRATLPPVMTFEGTTIGTYSRADNTITVDVGNLASGATGEAFIYATAENSLVDGQLVVVIANIVYTTTSDAQGEAVAYATHKGVRSSASVVTSPVVNALGANIFGSGDFLPTTVLGWMLLVVLVLILVLLGNHVYGRFSGPSTH